MCQTFAGRLLALEVPLAAVPHESLQHGAEAGKVQAGAVTALQDPCTRVPVTTCPGHVPRVPVTLVGVVVVVDVQVPAAHL